MIRIITLTEAGQRLGAQIQRVLGQEAESCTQWHKPQPFAEQVRDAFRRGERLIFICATGIVVRTLAPVIADKRQDPPVLVLDEQGQFVIPLLSGHEGGANDWAATLSARLRRDGLATQLVLTTANPYLKPVYTVGMGCERYCPREELQRLLEACLTQVGLEVTQIDSINSIDLKADELGLIRLGETLQIPYRTWSPEQLGTMDPLLSTRSEYVFKTVGVYGVAESAALYAAQQKTGQCPELVLTKQKTAKATCAIARSYPAACTDDQP